MNPRERGGMIFRLLLLLVLCAFAGLFYVARRPLLRLAGNLWISEDQLEHADAIIVLGDDNFAGDRASRAATLFRAGWAPQVVASGRMLRADAGIAELIERDLEGRGVPAASIVRFDHHADNTLEEAEALRGLAGQRGWRRILVVTSNYHTRRARYIFRHVFDPAVWIGFIPAADSQFDAKSWWESRAGRKIFFLETVGYVLAMWELHQGAKETAPGANRLLITIPHFLFFQFTSSRSLYYSLGPCINC